MAELQQAAALIEAGERQEAARILLPLVKSERDNVMGWWLLAHALREPDAVRKALEQVVRLQPDHPRAGALLAELDARYAPDDPFAAFDYEDFPAKESRLMTTLASIREALFESDINYKLILSMIGSVASLVLFALFILLFLRQQVQEFNDALDFRIEDFNDYNDFTLPDTTWPRGSLEYGQTVHSRVPAMNNDSWTFTGQKGDSVLIDIEPLNSFAWEIMLYTPSGQMLGYTADSDAGYADFSVLQADLPADGTYTITISAFPVEGEYELTLDTV